MMKQTAHSLSVYDKDKSQRQEAIFERERDVVVLAGAGSGKTTLLTLRFVERVAPADDKNISTPIERLAAVTFTRKAAGELKNRIRLELLSLLEKKVTDIRKKRIEEALSNLDFSFIGTIHSFADRLLRLRPIEAKISPTYKIIEDSEFIVQETVARWIDGAETDTLMGQWSQPSVAATAEDCAVATAWLKDLMAADVKRNDYDSQFATMFGIEGLVRSWINLRDRENPVEVSCPYSPEKTDRALQEILKSIQDILSRLKHSELDIGSKHLRSIVSNLERALAAASNAEKIRWLTRVFVEAKNEGKNLTKSAHFSASTEHGAWELYKQLCGNPSKEKANLQDDVFAPLIRSLLVISAKVQPIILSLFEDVKKRHQAIDQLDLLIILRNVLRNDLEVKKNFENIFEHIFVDEFQDTDPIQVEIILTLCTRPGSLTIIGDPKQSIYRFRRADIGLFAETVSQLLERGALKTELKVNFRSRPGLIRAFNSVFSEYFGHSPSSKKESQAEFDSELGWVVYASLEPSPEILEGLEPCVKILRLDAEDIKNGDEKRPQEAKLAARHIAWLLSPECPQSIRSADASAKIQGKDIAIICRAMTHVSLLINELRILGIQSHASGGREFAKNPLLHSYILLLNSIADENDGPGQLAAHQFPFSSVTILDAATQKNSDTSLPEGALQKWLHNLRKNRFSRPVLHVALDCIEQSLALRMLGLGLNAEEDLAPLYRFANILHDTAAENNWNFDEAVRWARTWIDTPPQVNSPAAESDESVRIMTIHQSKGLEFPVVYLFDGFAKEGTHQGSGFSIAADGKEWSISVGNLKAEFNPYERSPTLKERETSHTKEEQKRLHYVAATRAKDFLIIPIPDPTPKSSHFGRIWNNFLDNSDARIYPTSKLEENYPHLIEDLPKKAWLPAKIEKINISMGANFAEIAEKAASLTEFTTVTKEAQQNSQVNTSSKEEVGKLLPANGKEFGKAVHRAVYLHLAGGLSVTQAVAVSLNEIDEKIDELQVSNHVQTARVFFEKNGYLDGSWTVFCEFPFVNIMERKVIKGIIDLLFVKDDTAHIFDIKTEANTVDLSTQSKYSKQLGMYEDAVKSLLPGCSKLKSQLLMTAEI